MSILTDLNAVYTDLITTGNTLFESAQTTGFTSDAVITELRTKKSALEAEIAAMRREIGASRQDFADNYHETPELKKLHVIEDYTLAIFWVSYIFMALALVYLYAAGAGLAAAAVGLLAAGIVGAVLAGLLYWAL